MRYSPVIWTIAAVAILAGCGATTATKAGKRTGPVVLRMASRDSSLTYDFAADYFAKRVEKLSHGQLRIMGIGPWGNLKSGAEQQIVRDIASGKVDLGAVGTRVLDTLGVSSFQALTAPLLIDSYPHERAVIASDVPREMLGGLTKLGVTGLAVLGGNLRKPVAVKSPLLEPRDWRGITFAAFRSRAAAAAIKSLGARLSDLWDGTLSAAITTGAVEGTETDLFQYWGNARESQVPYMTANVNLWPRTEVVLANTNRLSGLTRTEQGWLRQAGADAASHSTTQLSIYDQRFAVLVCKQGAHLLNASPTQLAALRRAFKPVYASLERDPQTRDFIARIEQLQRSTPSGPPLAIPVGCTGRGRNAPAAKSRPSNLDGTYRIEWSEKELIAAGAPPGAAAGDFGYAHGGKVVLTWTLRGGRFSLRANPASITCPGTYAVSGATVTIDETAPACQGHIEARWSISHGLLRLRVKVATGPGDAQLFGAKPWTKIAAVH